MLYLPLGLRSQSTGTLLPISVKSSSSSGMSAEWAMANRWRTAFVEPPRQMTTVIAFSNASRVMMSRGQIFFSIRLTTAAPAASASRRFSSDTASCAELSGKLIPRASIADDIVLAVYIPPQEPAPGIALVSISFNSSSLSLPPEWAPTASNTETISKFCSL